MPYNAYFPFGSPGGGAPLRDSQGDLITNLRGRQPKPWPPNHRAHAAPEEHVDPQMLSDICRKIQAKVLSRYRNFKDAFIRLDRARTGVIGKEQLRGSLVRLGVVGADHSRCSTMEYLLDRCDPMHTGAVRYADFAAQAVALNADADLASQLPPVPAAGSTRRAPSEQYGIGNRILPNRHSRKPVGGGLEAGYGIGTRTVEDTAEEYGGYGPEYGIANRLLPKRPHPLPAKGQHPHEEKQMSYTDYSPPRPPPVTLPVVPKPAAAGLGSPHVRFQYQCMTPESQLQLELKTRKQQKQKAALIEQMEQNKTRRTMEKKEWEQQEMAAETKVRKELHEMAVSRSNKPTPHNSPLQPAAAEPAAPPVLELEESRLQQPPADRDRMHCLEQENAEMRDTIFELQSQLDTMKEQHVSIMQVVEQLQQQQPVVHQTPRSRPSGNLPSPFSKARRRQNNPHPPVPHYSPAAADEYGMAKNRRAPLKARGGGPGGYGFGKRNPNDPLS